MIHDTQGGIPKPSAQKNAAKSDFTLQSPISESDITSLLWALSKKGFPPPLSFPTPRTDRPVPF
jgi:hypothetical protein